MITPLTIGLVAAGGAFGAVTRFWVNGLLAPLTLSSGFPYGTLTVNILGSFLMGIFIGIMARHGSQSWLSDGLHLLVAIGFLGGLTTFSSFALDAVTLIERHAIPLAAAYMLGSVLCSVGGLFGGLYVMRAVS